MARTRTVTRYVVRKPRIVRGASFVRFPFCSDIVVSYSVLFRSLFLCLLARRLVRSFGVVSRDHGVWIILAWSSHVRHYFVRKDSPFFFLPFEMISQFFHDSILGSRGVVVIYTNQAFIGDLSYFFSSYLYSFSLNNDGVFRLPFFLLLLSTERVGQDCFDGGG